MPRTRRRGTTASGGRPATRAHAADRHDLIRVTGARVDNLKDISVEKGGALKVPGCSMDGWYGRIFRGCGYFDPDRPIASFTKVELEDRRRQHRRRPRT